ncbi:uncharacterized protein LOC131948204 [Physella acuta]|uniref:uncharacterized protein LOC131948204 n=1 Tax=Physella acuta TaxID=109671 RepID=UPI0027DB8668|nr:uncharacterized protein LOC131948204 [Physella acuta]
MESKYLIIIAVAVLGVVSVKGQNTCQSMFLTNLNYCNGNRSIATDNFLWVARNGGLGAQPTDLNGFMAKLCQERPGLYMCVKAVVDNAQTLPDTQCNATQKASLMTLFKGLFKTINKKCEDPCRATFKQSLTKCYTDLNFLTQDVLLFGAASPRDRIIGVNATEAQRLCQNRTSILQCLNTAASTCKDSQFLLQSYGLDLTALSETYTVLCNYSSIYMESVKCFENPSTVVQACRNTISTRTTALTTQLDDLDITEVTYRDELCKARFEQIECELGAVKAANNTAKCSKVILGFRQQQECLLLPRACMNANAAVYNQMCKETEFYIPERAIMAMAYNSGGALMPALLTMALVTVAVSVIQILSLM